MIAFFVSPVCAALHPPPLFLFVSLSILILSFRLHLHNKFAELQRKLKIIIGHVLFVILLFSGGRLMQTTVKQSPQSKLLSSCQTYTVTLPSPRYPPFQLPSFQSQKMIILCIKHKHGNRVAPAFTYHTHKTSINIYVHSCSFLPLLLVL